nr:muellerian-inhibiting factor-like [Pogona vitticeps]
MAMIARRIVFILSLMSEAASVPTKGNLLGEPEAPALREPPNPEDVADFGRPWVEDTPGLVNRGDVHGRSPSSKRFGDRELRSFWPLPSFLSWPHGVPDEPVCQVKLERGDLQSPHLLQVVGLLNSYDSSFLKAVSSSSWGPEELEIFGMCPTDAPYGLLSSLQHVGDSLALPEENHFLLLHMAEVKWELAATKLRFELAIGTAMANTFGLFHLALLVFYRGEEISGAVGPWHKFLVGGEGLSQTQVVCLSRQTRYLVLQASATLGSQTPGRIIMTFSLGIKHLNSTGATLSPQEAQDLLFGFDAQCFTRRTPAVFLLAQRKPAGTAFPLSSFLAADGKVDMIPYLNVSDLSEFGVSEVPSSPDALAPWINLSAPIPTSTRQFLEVLSQFFHKVLSSPGEPPLASRPHLQLDLGMLEGLPHMQLNLPEALEQLVQVEDHLVVLFPEDHQAWVNHQVAQWSLRGALLEQLLTKLRSVIRDLEALPSFQANVDLFRVLLAFCYYPPGGQGDSSVPDAAGAEGSRTAGEKFHSLFLLKALQAVRARWWESRQDTPRGHRRARHHDDYCRLREFEIDLVSTSHIILPNSYNANNCVGPCRSPLSTRILDHYPHTIFLLHMQEQGIPVTRPPCCIPVKYSPKPVITFTKDLNMAFKVYPNMVAESCGCR